MEAIKNLKKKSPRLAAGDKGQKGKRAKG